MRGFFSARPGSLAYVQYRERKIAKLKLDLLDWAPKSSDLNPIEMLLSILDEKLASKPIYSKAALMDHLQEE